MNKLTPEYVSEIPEPMSAGKIYISKTFKLAMHLCPCGCGGEVVTRLGAGGWKLEERAGAVSLFPSIGPSTMHCRSHYWLRNSTIEWLRPMTEEEIRTVRTKDAALRKAAFEAAKTPWYVKLWRWLVRPVA